MKLTDIAAFLGVLADETRLRIVHALFEGQARAWSVGELVEVLGLPQPTVSRHLGVLRHGGLVQRRSAGTYRLYELSDAQPGLHAAVLAALEAYVTSSPVAREDAARLAAIESDGEHLTPSTGHATTWLPEDDAAMDRVFKALGHPARRRILDLVGASPGCTLGAVAAEFDASRVAVSKHIGVLERAGLLHSRRRGRERHLYADAMPVQLMYDRWTDRLTAPLAARMADVKYAAEEETS